MINSMKEANMLSKGQPPSNSTIYRYVKTIRPQKGMSSQERHAFEAPYAGNLWQTDIMYGPYLPYKNEKGKWCKKQTFLVAIIDDHSRLLCHGEFYFKQDILSYLSCLKMALAKRGIPEKLYCDNGQVFLSSQVKRIMAELGTIVLHTQVRDCAAKGKIERFFLTVRNCFLDPLMELDPPAKLDDLNRKFWKWGEESYNNKEHSMIKMKPIERWMLSSHKVRFLSTKAENETFYFTTTRKVKKDGTISFDSKIYETSSSLVGKKVDIKYDPFFTERPFVSYDNQDYGRATPLDREFNNKLPRNNKKENNKNERS
jgi:transposase InsO family protein